MRVRIKRTLVMMILAAVFMTSMLWADQERYLISVDISTQETKNFMKDIDPPVYLVTEESIIAGYSNLSYLDKVGIKYRVIDREAWSGHYYIVTNKRGDTVNITQLPGEKIFSNDQLVLLKKVSELDINRVTSSPYHFAELYDERIDYHYETIISDKLVQQGLTYRYRTPEIDDLLEEINVDSLRYFIQNLEDFGTRFAYADNRYEVVSWIESQFRRFGYNDVVTDTFYVNRTDQSNVIATLPGNVNPEQVVIISGHYDSISQSDPNNRAPGADDNASGTAAALEIARAMKAVDFQPETTVRFITYAAEEVGLHGSRFYAENAREQDMNIKLMINNDMIAHNLRNPGEWEVRLFGYTGAENFAHFSGQIFDEYTSIEPQISINNSSNSDSYSFFRQGYPAVFFMERDFNPYYHSVNDLLIHLDLDYALEIVKASAAVSALINIIPDIPRNLTVQDAGSGDELLVSWSPVTSSDIERYNVQVGLTSGNYNRSIPAQDTTVIISGLDEDTKYYVGVASVGAQGYVSAIVEKTGTPRMIPLSPESFTVKPQMSYVSFDWTPNNEADLDGYRLYRSVEQGELGSPVHNDLLKNTHYIDTGLDSGGWYYYSLTAVDGTNNESEPTKQHKTRLLTMDQGVLIVADTTPGSGGFMRPDIDSVTEYYNEALVSFNPDIYDLWDHRTLNVADVGAYSTVVWHKNDSAISPYSYQVKEALKEYLDLGGNLLVSSFFPSRLFEGHQSYPFKPQEGSFIYDYLKIKRMDYDVAARFSGAYPQVDGYPFLEVDVDKIPEAVNHHLFQIETGSPSPGANSIYAYDTKFDLGQQEALLKGLPVGVEYIGEKYSTVTLTFPLYYIKKEHAQALIEYVMNERFQETVSAEDKVSLSPAAGSLLYQNYPNPFNPQTTISYYLEGQSHTELMVYNVKGQKVNMLFEGEQPAGEHSIVWTGKDENNSSVASGIYFLRLKTDFGESHIRMLLVK